ncbi:AraC family transcriptional regulator [Conexibacter sp. SYSU D00693]|uniref:AraC family transcriptional regulator n=1 Tax=Conexibacter sp. SYSU D00693 TaxID=2812560 RepID=UPI00196AF1D2|nr:AraC family transcriptional regulator [Conexibacter sp. SYSU D00693]
MDLALERLRDGIDRHAQQPRTSTRIDGLTLFRQAVVRDGVATMYQPSLCVVAGGRKQVVLGDRVFDLGPGDLLVVAVEVPVTGCVVAATPEDPYLGLTVDLDRARLADLLLTLPPARGAAPSAGAAAGIATGQLDGPLLDALARLVGLLDEPQAAPALAPLVERELHFRLLTGDHAPLVRQIATADSHLAQIASATDWIREHHAEPMRVEELARRSAMSATSFHRHFKAVTMLTPLEYRTRIRLQEARRLMLVEDLDAASIGLAVGYESPSQFSREYRRHFGATPAADAVRLRAQATGRVAA